MESNSRSATRKAWSRSTPSPVSRRRIRRSKKFVAELWSTPVPDGLERYYEGLLYLMSLLHCSGEFKIWSK